MKPGDPRRVFVGSATIHRRIEGRAISAVYVAGMFRDSMTIDGHTLEVGEGDDYDTVLMKLCP